MTLTEEQRDAVAFDLEKARASIAHYRIENPSNVDTESAIKELVDQANLAEDAVAEIERLRAYLEQSERVIEAGLDVIDQRAARIKSLKKEIRRLKRASKVEQEFTNSYIKRLHDAEARIKELGSSLDEAEALTKKNAELMNGYLRRIAELEDALVEGLTNFLHYRASCYDPARRCPYAKECDDCSTWDACGHVEKFRSEARRRLQAEGKIGPDAKSVNKGNQCQYCKKCGRDMRFEFSIRDEIWNKLPKTWKDRVLCIECFLEELNEVEPDQEIHFDDFNYMCILDPIEDTEWKGDRPKLLHPLFGGTLIDAKNPLAWQITEERKAAIWHAVAVLKENDPDDEHLWDEEIAVLRAMLTEAE